jgi:flavin-dependent dehydrogenase
MAEDGGIYEVAVVGGGLAGGALALRLARRGARVALIEGSAYPRPKLCGEYLSPEGVRALHALGLGPALEAAGGEPIGRVRITAPGGRSLEAEVAGPGDPPGLGLSRSLLDDLLAGAAREAGAAVLENTRAGGPLVEEGRVVGILARDAARRPVEIRARLVVAANGRHSELVQKTGERESRAARGPAYFGLKRHLRNVDPAACEPAGCVGLHLVAGGYVGACRVEGGLTNVCGLLPDALARSHRGDLDALAAARFPSNPALGTLWRAGEPADDWKTVAGVRIERWRARLPGILYAGDCRGTVDPLGGQGMTMALLGAELAEPWALRMLTDPAGSLGSVGSFERAWRARFRRRIALCRFFHHLLVRPGWLGPASRLGPIGPALLALGFRLTRDPPRARPPASAP